MMDGDVTCNADDLEMRAYGALIYRVERKLSSTIETLESTSYPIGFPTFHAPPTSIATLARRD